MKQKVLPRLIFLSLIVLLTGICFMTAMAQDDSDENSFSDFIAKLKADQTIPDLPGEIISYGSYERSLANTGYWDAIPLLEADQFVIGAKFKIESGIRTPNGLNSGCGFFFNTAPGGSQFLMASVRMDGNAYLKGESTRSSLSYGSFNYSSPSNYKEGEMMLVYAGNRAEFYLDGEFILSQSNLPVMGNMVGLGILSGAYSDFGTRCTFDDIQVYTWE